jgi:hypothetical protein
MEMSTFSPKRRAILCGALAALLAASLRPRTSAAQAAANESALLARVKDYYEALSSQKFDDVWTYFLAEHMKRDTPREQYVKLLAASMGKSKLTIEGPTEVRIDTTGRREPRPLGRSVTPIKVVTDDNQTVYATHTTYWLFQEIPNRRPGWMLASDEMKEKN